MMQGWHRVPLDAWTIPAFLKEISDKVRPLNKIEHSISDALGKHDDNGEPGHARIPCKDYFLPSSISHCGFSDGSAATWPPLIGTETVQSDRD